MLLILTNPMTDNTIAYLEMGDARSDLDHLTSYVYAKDNRVSKSGKHHASTLILYHPVDWVDGYCTILDDNLVLTRGSVRCGFDLQGTGF
jgi:hypothetical protein